MTRFTNTLTVLPKDAEKTAKADLPFGAFVDSITEQLEGYKRRGRDGFRFADTPHNIRLIRANFPHLEIELPPDWSRSLRVDIPLGVYAGPKATPLYEHQKDALAKSKDATQFAYLLEQGTGKTRVVLDKIGHHYAAGELTGVLVVTFKGIHEQWVQTQIPQHLGTLNDKPIDYYAAIWNPKNKDHLFKNMGRGEANRLEFFTMNFEALNGADGQTLAEAFAWRHHGALMVVVDESHGIKQYDSRRSLACRELAKIARFRIIMSGTPIPKCLEEEWAQSLFLSEEIFGYRYVTTFRSQYVDRDGKDRRIDEFRAIMEPHSFRITKDECLDLPPKIYEQFQFELSPVARKAYNELRRNFLTTISDEHRELLTTLIDADSEQKEIPDDLTFTVQNSAVLMLRLQQIASGRIVSEDGKTVKISSDRENALKDLLPKFENQAKIIVWTRFKQDVKDILPVVSKFGKAVLLTGDTPANERWGNGSAFLQDPKVKFLISNPAVGGTGYNFQGACTTNIYYTNSYNSVHRWQSEDRTHRIGTNHPVNYIDIIANNTIDEAVLTNLRNKKDFAALVLDVMRGLE